MQPFRGPGARLLGRARRKYPPLSEWRAVPEVARFSGGPHIVAVLFITMQSRFGARCRARMTEGEAAMEGQPVTPRGYRGIARNMGLKDVEDDFTAVVSEVPARSAAVFTKSRFAGPSVLLSRAAAARRSSRGMVVLSRNANVATGRAGAAHAEEVRRRVAEIAGVDPEDLVIGSTGVIGRPYPIESIRAGLDELSWPFPEADFDASAKAIMTTDTHPKCFSVRC